MEALVIYHRADLDGLCSAAIVKMEYENPLLVGVDYGETPPWDEINKAIEKGWEIYLLDFSFPPEDMEYIADRAYKNFVWIDHHKTAINDCKNLMILGIRQIGTAACVLTWTWFNNKKFSIPVKLLGDYDVWNKSDIRKWNNHILPFQYGVKFHCQNIQDMELLLCDNIFAEKCLCDGGLIMRYERQKAQKMRSMARLVTIKSWKDFEAMAVNTSGSSNLFEWMEEKEKLNSSLIRIVYYQRGDGKWKVTLFSRDPGKVDVSEIAKYFGGGGHVGAAGFICDKLPF